MAIICFTTVFIEGNNKRLQDFENFLIESEKKIAEKEKIIEYVLKNKYINTAGLDINKVAITDIYMHRKNVLLIKMESFWEPKIKWLKKLMVLFDPTAKIYFYAEEPSTELYESNDKDQKYFGEIGLDTYFDEEYIIPRAMCDRYKQCIGEYNRTISKDAAEKIFNKFLQTDNLSLDKIKDILEKNYDYDSKFGLIIKIHEIYYIDLDSQFLA